MPTATLPRRTSTLARAWERVGVVRLSDTEPSADGFRRSWIMLFPEGDFTHPEYGRLRFTHQRLSEIKQHFDDRVRHIDIALDANHDQDKATGWLERLEMRPAGTTATTDGHPVPAGLWGLVRWTPLGVQYLKDQIYRYFSPEFGPWTDPETGHEYEDVLIGGGLTNRPFLKSMDAVQLAEGAEGKVSTRPWSEVDKSCLPRACFLIKGDPKHPTTWRLPVYEGTGPKDASGRYTRRGALNINGVRAAIDAIGGARTGKPMAGVPAGTKERLERLLDRYSPTRRKEAGKAASTLADGRAAARGANPRSDTHAPMDLDSGEAHQHGTYGYHFHTGDADHRLAPRKGERPMEYDAYLAARKRLKATRAASEPHTALRTLSTTRTLGSRQDGPSAMPKYTAYEDDEMLSDDLLDEHAYDLSDDEDEAEAEADDESGYTLADGKRGRSRKPAAKGKGSAAPGGEDEEPDEDDEGEEGMEMDDMAGDEAYAEPDDSESDEEAQGEEEEPEEEEGEEEEKPMARRRGSRRSEGRSRSKKASEGAKGAMTLAEAVRLREEVRTFREENAQMRYRLYENEVAKTLDGWGKGTFQFKEGAKTKSERVRTGAIALSKVFRERYRSFMLKDGIRLTPPQRRALNELVETALSAAIVDLTARGTSYDQEARRTRKLSDRAPASLGMVAQLEDEAQKLAAEQNKTLAEMDANETSALYERAAKRIGYH